MKRYRKKYISRSGYEMVYDPKHPVARHGVALVHRIKMYERLGRPLEPGEWVHHRNGDRLDNRPSNLDLMTPSDHARLHLRKRRRKAS